MGKQRRAVMEQNIWKHHLMIFFLCYPSHTLQGFAFRTKNPLYGTGGTHTKTPRRERVIDQSPKS